MSAIGNTLSENFKPGEMDTYAWPGGYPLFAIVDDGESLCPRCVNDPSNPVHVLGDSDGWKIIAIDVNWEDEDNTCAHCASLIPSAYGTERQVH